MRSMRVAFHVVKRLPWPIVALTAAGWALIAALALAQPLPTLCLSIRTIGEGTLTRLALALEVTGPAVLSLTWLAMLLAMMPPLLASPLLHVWHRSLRRRRVQAIALFFFGYMLAWFAAGMLLILGALLLDSIAEQLNLPAFALAALVALIWQVSPLKQDSLNRCHGRPPLAAFGYPADADALRYGLSHGLWCVGTCWALMLLPLTVSGLAHWLVMVAAIYVLIVERVRAPVPSRWGAAGPYVMRLAWAAGVPMRSAA